MYNLKKDKNSYFINQIKMSNTASHLSYQVYHEKENINSTDRLLLMDKQVGQFWVKCSKALLNCLLQKEEFRFNIKLKINSHQLESVYNKLKLYQHFKIQELNNWLNSKADLFGSILAVYETLASRNIYLSPVEDATYTSLVEKPTGYLCVIEEGWVVLRFISHKWYMLDPRNSSANPLSDTYLHLIIKQLLNDKGLIFQITGGVFSQLLLEFEYGTEALEGNEAVDESNDNASTSQPSVGINSETSRYPFNRSEIDSIHGEVNLEPKPPDITGRYRCINLGNRRYAASDEQGYIQPRPLLYPQFQQERKEEVMRMLSDLSKLKIGSIMNRKKRPVVRRSESNLERSRSEVRQAPSLSTSRSVLAQQSVRQPSQQPSYNDANWPPLDEARQRPPRRRRARSAPRTKPNQSNQYSPPTADSSTPNERQDRDKTTQPTTSTSKPRNSSIAQDESTCCICLELKPDHALYPCGHQCLCSACKLDFLAKFNECPFCKRKVTDAIKIFKT